MATVAFSAVAALLLNDADRGGLLAAASVAGMLVGTPASIALQRAVSTRLLLSIQLLLCSGSWLALAVSLDRSFGVWVVIAAVAGFSMAGSAGLIRSTMSTTVRERRQSQASTLDALAQDALVFLAPVLVAVGLGIGAAGAPMAVSALALAAVIAVQFLKPSPLPPESGEEAVGTRRGQARRPLQRWLTWTVFSLGVGMLLGAVEAGAVGLSLRLDFEVRDSWLVFLVLGIASAIGAWVDIAYLQRTAPARRLPLLVVTFLAGAVLLTLEPTLFIVLTGLLLVGLPTAALLGLRSHVFDCGDPANRKTGLTLAFAGQSIGFAAGAACLAFLGQTGALVAAGLTVALGGALGIADLRRHPTGPSF